MLRLNTSRRRSGGYTLMEVVVGAAVGMVVLLIVGTFMVLGIRSHADAIEKDRISSDRRATQTLITSKLTQAELPLREALTDRIQWRLDDGSGSPFHVLWLDTANPESPVLRYSTAARKVPSSVRPSDGVVLARLAIAEGLQIAYLDGAATPIANQAERLTQTRQVQVTYRPMGGGPPVELHTGVGIDGPLVAASSFPNGDFTEAGDGTPLARWSAQPASALARVTEPDGMSASLSPAGQDLVSHLHSDYFLARGDDLTLRVLAATAQSVCRVQLLDAAGNPVAQRSPSPSVGRWVAESISTAAAKDQTVRLRLSAQGGSCRFADVASAGTTRAAATSAYSTLVLNDNPAGYWRLGEASGETALDATNNHNDGTYVGGSGHGAPGLIVDDADTAVRFDGGTTGASAVRLPENVGAENTITVDAWVKIDGAISSWRGIAVRQGRWGLFVSEGQLAIYDFATAQMRGTGMWINDGTPHHVALVWRNGVSNGSEVYLDGQRVMTTTMGSIAHSGAVSIGSAFVTGAGQNFDGRIDEVAITDRALGAADIRKRWDLGREMFDYAALVRSQPGLVGYWRLGESHGAVAHDESGHARNGSYMRGNNQNTFSMALRHLGLLGNDPDTAVHMNGVDGDIGGNGVPLGDHVRLPANAAYNGGTISADAWIQTCNAGTGYRGIIVKQHAFGMFLMDNTIVTYDWGGTGPRATGVNLADCKRHHVALTMRSGVTNGTKLYVDGVERLTTLVTTAGNVNAVIGAGYPTGLKQNFAGTIDEVSIHNVILTPAQIKARWDAGK